MLPDIRDYDRLVAAFRWEIPERYNIGVDVCDRWAAAEPERPAILEVAPGGEVTVTTYGALRECSNRLANVLRARGVGPGDRGAALPGLAVVLSTDGPDGAVEGLAQALKAASAEFAPVDTGPDDPALMIYTSGTTGPA